MGISARRCATRKGRWTSKIVLCCCSCFVTVNILIFISVNVFFFSPLEDNYHPLIADDNIQQVKLQFEIILQFTLGYSPTLWWQNLIKRELKPILIWNAFSGPEEYNIQLGQQPLIDAKCPVTDCFFTDDQSFFNQSDVVLFVAQSMLDAPIDRSPHQRFVFYEM